MTDTANELVERVADAVAPIILFEYDGDTMDRALNWRKNVCDHDLSTMERIATAALEASGIEALQAEIARLRAALEAINDAHLPDQPATSALDETEWAIQHIRRTRAIARAALEGES